MVGESPSKVALATIVAPIAATLVAAAVYVTTFALLSDEPLIGGEDSAPLWIVSVWFYLALIALLATLLMGLPVHAALVRFRRTGVTYYVGAGLLGGSFVSVAMYFTRVIGDPLAIPLCGMLSGGLTGFFAWLIRRPDREAPANPPTSAA